MVVQVSAYKHHNFLTYQIFFSIFLKKTFNSDHFNFHYLRYNEGSQQVDYRWPGVGWGEFLVSNYDIVYASIDGRGTGFQSDEYTYQLYKQLGTVEMEVRAFYVVKPNLIFEIFRMS